MSPSQLIAFDLTAFALVCGSLSLLFLGASRPLRRTLHATGFWPYFGTVLCIVAFGAFISWRIPATLSDGVRLKRWTENELQKPRRFLGHPWTRALEQVSFVAAIILCVFLLFSRFWQLAPLFWYLIHLSMMLPRMRRSLQEPSSSSDRWSLRANRLA
jgi:hypothetical protein